MESDISSVKILLSEHNSDADVGVTHERVRVSRAGHAVYRIDSVPWFARNVDLGDEISIIFSGNEWVLDEVVTKSRNVSYHVRVSGNAHDDEGAAMLVEIRNALLHLGCTIEDNNFHLFSVSVPIGSLAFAVKDLLTVGEESGILEFESSDAAFLLQRDEYS